MNVQWDSDRYAQNFNFVYTYGQDVTKLIDVPKGSFVVDLGCGNGALTESMNAEGYRVLGLDASPEMIASARKLHPDIPFEIADACSFSLGERADCIFSNAVFHWIDADKQPMMLQNLSKNLKDGGILVTEFGGYGCAETVHRALETTFERHGLDYPRVFYFPTIGIYAPLMERAGMIVEYAVLFDRPTPQVGEDGLENWIRMFVQAPFSGMQDAQKDAIIREAVELAEPDLYTENGWIVDYVRIRIKARKRR